MPRVMQRSYSPMSSQLLNGPFGLALVLMPPRGRRGPHIGPPRDPAIRRIDDEPRPLVLAIEGVEDEMRRRAETAGELFTADALDETLVALLDDLLEFLGRDVCRASFPRAHADAPSASRSRRRWSRCPADPGAPRRARDRPRPRAHCPARPLAFRAGRKEPQETTATAANERVRRISWFL